MSATYVVAADTQEGSLLTSFAESFTPGLRLTMGSLR